MRAISFLIRIVFVTGVIYAAGFLVFFFTLPRPNDVDGESVDADAIVVLTGQGRRLGAAVDLLRRGAGRRLLITGVNPDIDKEELDRALDGGVAFNCCADLGFSAVDTRTNALETRDWARMHGYNSLIVVTGYEHMPRSLLEFSAEMPGVTLIPYAVGQSESGNEMDASLRQVNAEYAKYLASWIRLSLTAQADGAT
jgi:uncharacterized SAM-binding protein YcdF (DUF218 family)